MSESIKTPQEQEKLFEYFKSLVLNLRVCNSDQYPLVYEENEQYWKKAEEKHSEVFLNVHMENYPTYVDLRKRNDHASVNLSTEYVKERLNEILRIAIEQELFLDYRCDTQKSPPDLGFFNISNHDLHYLEGREGTMLLRFTFILRTCWN